MKKLIFVTNPHFQLGAPSGKTIERLRYLTAFLKRGTALTARTPFDKCDMPCNVQVANWEDDEHDRTEARSPC